MSRGPKLEAAQTSASSSIASLIAPSQHFRKGSFASVWPDHGDFRSTPVNGHSQDRRAIFRHGGLTHGTFVVAQGLAQHNKC
jgi:hypothetical protein